MSTRPYKHPRSSPSGEDRAPKRPAYSEPSVALQNGIQHDYADYSVAIVCALDFEMSAVRWILDRQHRPLPEKKGDPNLYVLGELSGHNVVIACLPGTQGKSAAAHVAANLERTFPRVQYRLLVGIGGGVPSDKHDIRLGDVVVSMPDEQYGGVVQYDLGKDTEDGFNLKGFLLPPPRALINAVGLMRSDHYAKPNRISEFILEMTRREPNLSTFYQRPSADSDILFKSGSQRTLDQGTCVLCNQSETVQRNPRLSSDPKVFYGLIASGDRVLKSAHKRDSIRGRVGDVLCFDMEACGLVTELPYMVIRGISDYADSHKNDQWQPYAAAVAAGYAKELLSYLDIPTAPVTHPRGFEEDVGASRLRKDGTYSPIEVQIRRLLDSLDFKEINNRQEHVRLTYTKTCRWLHSKREYLDWLDSGKFKHHHGFLWIKGKPGSGKTTIMQYAYMEAKREMKEKVVISFFFNAQGVGLEKSTNGMYRSLLLQLHRVFPELHYVLLNCVRTLNIDIGSSDKDWQFNTETLEYMFREAIYSLKQISLVLFIDALDECNEDEVRDMISFFRQLGESEVVGDEAPHFQVCFSSRHYPYISTDPGLSLTLQDQEEHEHAIAKYVVDELKIGNSKTANEIRCLLQKKADGVFMWAVFVVGILNKEYDCGGIDKLRGRLRDIPDNLHALFRSILKRDRNSGGKDALLLCIQWVLFARHPLTLEEFYFAIRSGTSPEPNCEWDANNITRDVMQRFILDSSKGLVETTRSCFPTVQFIHESVVDFLLKENGFAEIWHDIGTNFRGLGHERLRACCVNYMNISIPTKFQPYTRITHAGPIIPVHPLMEYATHNVFYHSDRAEEAGIAQGQFLASFNVSKWVLLDNAFAFHRIQQHTQNVSLLYLLAELNAPHLIKAYLSVMSYFDVEEERYGTPLFAALAMGNQGVIRAFLRAHAAQRPSRGHLSELYNLYCQKGGTDSDKVRNFSFSKSRGILFNLIALDDETLFQFAMDVHPNMLNEKYCEGHTPLTWAISHGRLGIIKLLLEKYQIDVNLQDQNGHTALSLAAKRGYETIAKLILDESEGYVNLQGKDGRTAVSYAAENGHGTIVKLFLDKSETNFNQQDNTGRTAVSYAAENGHGTIVKLFLDKSETNFNQQDNTGRTAVSYAAENGHGTIVKLFLDKSETNFNQQDNTGRTAVSYAAENGHGTIVKLFLEKSETNFNQQDNTGRTAVSYAAENGHGTIVKLFLDKSETNFNQQDNTGRTAVSYAAVNGHESVVKLFLDKSETDFNQQDNTGRTPLMQAAMNGHESVVKCLLEKDETDVSAQDPTGKTALFYAAMRGYKVVVKLILKKSETDVNKQDNLGQTPLSEAVWNNHRSVVKLLLATETVNVNLQNKLGDTPFSHAAMRNSTDIGRLLLESNKVDPAIVARYRLFCSKIRKHNMFYYAILKGDPTLYKRMLKQSDVFKF